MTTAVLDAALTDTRTPPVRVRVCGRVWDLPGTLPALVPLRIVGLDVPWSECSDDDALTVGRALTPHLDEWLNLGVAPARVRQLVSFHIARLRTIDVPSPGGQGGVPARVVLDRFELLEADFAREYDIDLAAALPSLSWRRFKVLLAGLSTSSRWALALRHEPKRVTLTDSKMIEAYVRGAF